MKQDVDIMTLGLEDAWEMFVTLNEELDYIYEKARWGIKIKFDIYDYLNGAIQEKIKTGKVHIKGIAYESSDYYSELEIRKKLIKRWLLENYQEEEIWTMRGEE